MAPVVLLNIVFLMACSSPVSLRHEISANVIIPDPPPTADISQWRPLSGRTPLLTDLSSAKLRGFRYEGSNPQAPTVLFFNGNGMTVLSANSLYNRIAALGPTVIAYDYRGYGFSNGKPDLLTYRQDGLQLYDNAATATPSHRVIVYGFSMGTAIASYIASQRQPTAVILAAPIASAMEEFPVFGRAAGMPSSLIAASVPSGDAQMIFGEAALVSQSHAPLLVLHGDADELVPITQGREVFAASPSTLKQFVQLPGVEHNGTATSSDSMRAISKFLSKL